MFVIYSWLLGTAVILTLLALLPAIGYVVRELVPYEEWTSPLRSPDYNFNPEEVVGSVIVGFITVIIIIVPLLVGAAILS